MRIEGSLMCNQIDAFSLVEFTFDFKKMFSKWGRSYFVNKPKVFAFINFIKEPRYIFNTRVNARIKSELDLSSSSSHSWEELPSKIDFSLGSWINILATCSLWELLQCNSLPSGLILAKPNQSTTTFPKQVYLIVSFWTSITLCLLFLICKDPRSSFLH